MFCIMELLLLSVTIKHSTQFIFPDMLSKREDGVSDMSISRDFDTKKVDKELINKININLGGDLVKEARRRKNISALNVIEDLSVCRNDTDFCSDPIVYPTKAISRALRKQKRAMKSMFDKFDTDLYRLRLRSGIDVYQEGENVCSVSTTHIMPKAARNKKGEFKFLVNGVQGDEDYIQLVRITQCLGAGESCGRGKIFSREVTECRQEYADHKLVALDEEGKELIVDTFSFPSCCSCFMQRLEL